MCVCEGVTDVQHYTGLSDSKICNKRCCFLNKCGFIPSSSVSFWSRFMRRPGFHRHLFSGLHGSQKCHSQLGQLLPAQGSSDVPWGVVERKQNLRKQNKTMWVEHGRQISRFTMSVNDRKYFIFVDDAHFCHVYSEVVLVWHDDLDFLHLWRQSIYSLNRGGGVHISLTCPKMLAYFRNSLQNQNLGVVKRFLHARWELPAVVRARKLLHNRSLGAFPVEDETLTFWRRVGRRSRRFYRTTQRWSPRCESGCSATCCRPRCRSICPWSPAEWWNGPWGTPQSPTGWSSAGSCPSARCEPLGRLQGRQRHWIRSSRLRRETSDSGLSAFHVGI